MVFLGGSWAAVESEVTVQKMPVIRDLGSSSGIHGATLLWHAAAASMRVLQACYGGPWHCGMAIHSTVP